VVYYHVTLDPIGLTPHLETIQQRSDWHLPVAKPESVSAKGERDLEVPNSLGGMLMAKFEPGEREIRFLAEAGTYGVDRVSKVFEVMELIFFGCQGRWKIDAITGGEKAQSLASN